MIFIYEHFKTRKEARDRRAELEKKGFTCAIEKGDTTWTLAVGAPELFDPDRDSVCYTREDFETREEARLFRYGLEDNGKYAMILDLGEGSVKRWGVVYPLCVVHGVGFTGVAIKSEEPLVEVKDPVLEVVSSVSQQQTRSIEPLAVICGELLQITCNEGIFEIRRSESEEVYQKVFDHISVQEYDEAIGEILVWLERKNEFTTLADNLIMKDGKLYYYGVEMRSTIAKKIEKDYADGTLDDRYVKFLVRLLRNPSAKSVNMLYDFMQANDIQIAEDGRIICYKGVQFNGSKWVDWHSGKVPQYQGAFVSMPRNFVEDDPEAACSYGLHCASKEYAKSYGTVMTVMVDPADVVSVPYQHNSAKCRACRYEIVVAPEARKDGDPIEYVVDRDGNTIDILYEEA